MNPIQTILCPVDFSSISEREVRLAEWLCECLDARLVLQHGTRSNVPPGLGASWMFAEEHRRESEAEDAETQKRLQALIASLSGRVDVQAILTTGPLDRVVLQLASSLPADLMVIATHGPSTAEHRSLTERVILDARCPVLTIRDETSVALFPDLAPGAKAKTLVPVDFTAHSLCALEYAFALATKLSLEISVLHVDVSSRRSDAETRRSLQAAIPEKLRGHVEIDVRQGSPAEEILRREAELHPRLVVMGTHHKSAIRRLLTGSTARDVLHGSPCPVWFVPQAAAAAVAA